MDKARRTQLLAEYEAAAHAMQSGVAAAQALSPRGGSPKDLRVGINAALVETGVLARLLIEKGVITEEEHAVALRDGMVAEKERYERSLSQATGQKVTLA